jgi:hypothetical protein
MSIPAGRGEPHGIQVQAATIWMRFLGGRALVRPRGILVLFSRNFNRIQHYGTGVISMQAEPCEKRPMGIQNLTRYFSFY